MWRCVSIDLEVTPRTGRIHSFAAIRADTEETLTYPSAGLPLHQALAELSDFAEPTDFILGHNFIEFDKPHLQAAKPDLRLLHLPVVDTLWLNPLAFPRNPYHHLVKHYQDGQLLTGRKNDPLQDARLVLQLFADQQQALSKVSPDLLTAWHCLTGSQPSHGFDMVFEDIRRLPKPSEAEARQAIYQCIEGVSCRTHTLQTLNTAEQHGWSLAYALAWLSVAGGNSVMPPWVRHQFPEAGKLVRHLRDLRCGSRDCPWCQERHDARKELKRFFGFDGFRPKPADTNGYPLQQSIVEATMGGHHTLGILPTGTGKSLCYQIPALSRYEKTGAVTVVISPLVALMADQVTGLEARGIASCITINGMLSMPERADALERLRLGDAAIVLISPEQLRSMPFRRSLAQREIGGWVLDEAHCLSKWGHDFRPDYRYVGRYIREQSEGETVPPVLCLTATAKPGVKEEILDYFKKQLGTEMQVFDGGSHRDNLEFTVVETTISHKFPDINMILTNHLPPKFNGKKSNGGAIVYCATRKQTEEVTNYLRDQKVDANCFHGGLQPEEKKTIQRNFIEGDLQVIAATNAFGMGIDKPDIRLVIHADIPSSLENYLQEAGRAGRDQKPAHCVLLYTQQDVERQFSMSAHSRLTRREIQAFLLALRRLSRRNRSKEVVATPGEILSEDEDNGFRRDTATDDTRGKTAIAWLEESALLTREENQVKIYPSSLRVASVEEAREKLERKTMDERVRKRLLSIVKELIAADPDEGISTDTLMNTVGLTFEQVRSALYDLESLGIASNDTVLTAFVHVSVQHSSKNRLAQAAKAEETLLNLLQEMAPDMGVGDTSMLNLRIATQRLKDAGHDHIRTEHVVRILRGIAADGRGDNSQSGSISVRKLDPESFRITLKREWDSIVRIARRRRAGAKRLLDHLISCVPEAKRGIDLLAETTLGKLRQALEADLSLAGEVTNFHKLSERSLLWLHEQEVIRLNKGLTVFRTAMTIHLASEQRNFVKSDYLPLQIHYDETVRQIHIMAEYAQRGLANMVEAKHLAIDYFALDEGKFLHRWLPQSRQELTRQTTPESWHDIVESLNNPSQRRLVADDRENTNVLVLAGPGSGKTRVLVHRLAYLIRAKREDPEGILALAYNRHAALEIRRRLFDLVGNDSKRVLVLTCHALAMKLTGASALERVERSDSNYFNDILIQATALLNGKGLAPEDAEEARARLLARFRWILVDEYQDVGKEEYNLISALAGRTLSDEDSKLTLFAVGDDDQNIYTFKGSSVKYIRSFEQDYKARPAFLTENYRSTGYIIEAANTVIGPAQHRMKANHEIRIDRARAKDAAGGEWAKLDPVGRGKVQMLPAGRDAISQAQTALAELQRLRELAWQWNWSNCAVIAREWKYLEPVRNICEQENVPVQMANEDLLSVWHLRETQSLLDWLKSRGSDLIGNADLRRWLTSQQQTPWTELLQEALEAHEVEVDRTEVPVDAFTGWLAEWGRNVRRQQQGLLLCTAHRAKGLEFDHVVVIDGGWDRRAGRGEDPDASRRLYYVSMTRARQTLALGYVGKPNPWQAALRGSPAALWREPFELPPPAPELSRRHRQLNLKDVYLSFAGKYPPGHRVHKAIAALSPNDPLRVRPQSGGWELLNESGLVVAKLAQSFEPPPGTVCTGASVWAITTWARKYSKPEYESQLRSDTWEVVVPELIFSTE